MEYEFPEYTISENIGFVELCAVVTSHPGGTPRRFVIFATTVNGSASMYACCFMNMICKVIFFQLSMCSFYYGLHSHCCKIFGVC